MNSNSLSRIVNDALTYPFRTAFNTISSLLGGPEIKSLGGTIEHEVKTDDQHEKLSESIQKSNDMVVKKIDELINVMANGGIAVNIDGQRVNSVLSNSLIRRGEYGQSTIR